MWVALERGGVMVRCVSMGEGRVGVVVEADGDEDPFSRGLSPECCRLFAAALVAAADHLDRVRP